MTFKELLKQKAERERKEILGKLLEHYRNKGMKKEAEDILRKCPELDNVKTETVEEIVKEDISKVNKRGK